MPSGKFHEGSFTFVKRKDRSGMQWQRELTLNSCKERHIVSDHSELRPTSPDQIFVYKEIAELINDPVHHFKLIRVKLLRLVQSPVVAPQAPLEPRSRLGAKGFSSLNRS